MALEVYVKCLAKVAGTESGDAFWYVEEPPRVWAAVVDGLGSGPEAARAARKAVTTLRTIIRERGEDLRSLMEACDQALRGTRGAAMGVALLDADAGFGYYAGVGNIECRVMQRGRHIRPVSSPGIVGAGLRKVTLEEFEYHAGDLLVMHSDGLSSRFELSAQHVRQRRLEYVGEELVRHHAKVHDDMTLLLLRQHAG